MTQLPIKVLKDENKSQFIPFTLADGVYYDNTTSVKDKLDTKLEAPNLIPGSHITITQTAQGLVIDTDLSTLDPDKTYYHAQTTASDTWVISHNLNKYPAVSVIDSAGNEVEGEIIYNSINQITIMFKGAFKGSATLN